jgi:hypothetical protein
VACNIDMIDTDRVTERAGPENEVIISDLQHTCLLTFWNKAPLFLVSRYQVARFNGRNKRTWQPVQSADTAQTRGDSEPRS